MKRRISHRFYVTILLRTENFCRSRLYYRERAGAAPQRTTISQTKNFKLENKTPMTKKFRSSPFFQPRFGHFRHSQTRQITRINNGYVFSLLVVSGSDSRDWLAIVRANR